MSIIVNGTTIPSSGTIKVGNTNVTKVNVVKGSTTTTVWEKITDINITSYTLQSSGYTDGWIDYDRPSNPIVLSGNSITIQIDAGGGYNGYGYAYLLSTNTFTPSGQRLTITGTVYWNGNHYGVNKMAVELYNTSTGATTTVMSLASISGSADGRGVLQSTAVNKTFTLPSLSGTYKLRIRYDTEGYFDGTGYGKLTLTSVVIKP